MSDPIDAPELSSDEIRARLQDMATMTSARRHLDPVVGGLVQEIRRDPLSEDAPGRAVRLGEVLASERAVAGRAAASRVRSLAAAATSSDAERTTAERSVP